MNAPLASSATGPSATGVEIAAAIRTRAVTAQAVTQAALSRIAALDGRINAFTSVRTAAALAAAQRIDAAISRGETLGPLAGVPFAVKNLFDVAGETTLAGAKIKADDPPATQDAAAVAALESAGAVLIGGLNMDEFAYGFTTENTHYGPTRNPHDPSRVAGGSSGGCGAAVAAGMVPLTLGSDTNGSVRVPAALCGIFGLKPTYGRLSRRGMHLFAPSFDHVGVCGRSVADLATAYDLLQGIDPADPAQAAHPVEPAAGLLDQGIDGLRIAVLGGYFAGPAEPEALAAVEQVAAALGAGRRAEFPEVARARAAAFIITASEGGNLHLPALRSRPQDFDPLTRERFLAGALVPASWYLQAQRLRRWYRDRVAALFNEVDVVLAPTTPCAAPLIGQARMMIGGVEMATRPNLGIFTQPLSCIGLPVLSVPVWRGGGLPVGVQIIAKSFAEAHVLRVGAVLEALGIAGAPVAEMTSAEMIHA